MLSVPGFHHAAAKCDNKVIIAGDHAGDENDLEASQKQKKKENDLEEKIWA